MAFNRKILTAALAAATVVVGTVAAAAAPAVATTSVNVRSGPGTGYRVVDTLYRGQQVDVQYCRGSWCFVEKRGPDGWVSANYLRSGRPGWNDDDWTPRPPPRPPHWNPRPPHWDPYPPRPPVYPRPPRPPVYPYPLPDGPGASFCFNGPNGYFCVNS
ncbi:MAG: SH3 domain-containing protein [Devosia sp.]|uniref:SH3 domain-containing protein n=1 Tax=Devosia sp. TaxID=1871048 RepID=UPI0024C5D342|nr:SH3 domain-containing protein [Devosia sp.]UYO00995.1 MAG: SH3 domain-containing protein [Devosia sp.]